MQQFIRYGAIGAIATAVHYLLLVWCVERGAWPPWWASGFGAVAGAQVAYLGNRWFTFAHHGAVRASWPRFQATALAGALLGVAVVAFGVWLGLHYVLAQMLATVLGMLLTFSINRNWTLG